MKTVLLILISLIGMLGYSQTFSKEELSRYSGQGDKSDSKRAAEIAKEHPLNEFNELVLSCVQEYPGQSKLELYNKVYNWIVGMSSNEQSAIQVADTSKWIIQTRCNIQQIAKRTMGDNHYKVDVRPLLTFDFKDGRIRFTYTLQAYSVLKKTDDDGIIFMTGSFGFFEGGQKKDNQIWPLIECYPFAISPSHPKITASRALVNSYAAYNILVNRITGVLQKTVQNDDW